MLSANAAASCRTPAPSGQNAAAACFRVLLLAWFISFLAVSSALVAEKQ